MGILPIPRTLPYHAPHTVGGMGILPIPRIPYHVAHAVEVQASCLNCLQN